MDILTLLGLKQVNTSLPPSVQAWIKALQTIAIGALTTALMYGALLLTNQQQIAPYALLLAVAKTFLDAFGHGLAKYIRTDHPDEANMLDAGTNALEKEFDKKFPPVPPKG